MSDHLPECTYDTTVAGPGWTYAGPCICDRLRACEQRVRDELPPCGADALWMLLGQRKGLQAARDAVAAAKAVDISAGHLLDESRHFVWMHDALAAIDALVKS